jgi:hypothetical protein
MSGPNLLSSLQAAVSRVEGVGRGRRYPRRLQKRVVEYYRLRSSQGLFDGEIAAELGIPWKTIERWHARTPQPTVTPFHSPAFEPVRIVEFATPPPPPPSSRSTIVVRGPAGLCIEGLDLDGLTELVRRLS